MKTNKVNLIKSRVYVHNSKRQKSKYENGKENARIIYIFTFSLIPPSNFSLFPPFFRSFFLGRLRRPGGAHLVPDQYFVVLRINAYWNTTC